MTWKRKHDIILDWIDSCKTFEQLTNMIHFVKKQTFDNRSLLFFCSIKAKKIEADAIFDALESMGKLVRV